MVSGGSMILISGGSRIVTSHGFRILIGGRRDSGGIQDFDRWEEGWKLI